MQERRAAHQPRARDRRAAGQERWPAEDVPGAEEAGLYPQDGDRELDAAEDDRGLAPPQRGGRAAARMSAADAADAGLRCIVSLIGRQPEAITAVEPAEDGWLVGVEVVEDQRIPSSADILAIYQVQLAGDGTLMSYRRTRRYARGQGDSGDR